jgi:gamma-glutamylcyclotransferase (GGCT)/AIG2-like uncharacterized protein YtfP
MELFVYGDLLRGMERHRELADGEFLGEARTLAQYGLYALDGIHPVLSWAGGRGWTVVGELYQLSERAFERLLGAEPPGVYRACVVLANGRAVESTVCLRELVVRQQPIRPACWRTHRARGAHAA